MRLFIAIQFKKDINDSIIDIINQLKVNKVKGNFTRYENIHITLQFIGETKEVTSITKLIEEVVTNWRRGPLSLSFDGFSSFKRKEGELLYLKVNGDMNLEFLYQDIAKRLKKDEIPFDEKELKPHITLGRKVVFDKSNEKKEEILNKLSTSIVAEPIEIRAISLMKSERINGLLTYTPIVIYDLVK